MPHKWINALVSVALVSMVALVGLAFLGVRKETLRRAVPVMVGLAVGAMLGDVFIHLLPDMYARPGAQVKTSLGVLVGIFAFYLLELFVRGHHRHFFEDAESELSHPHAPIEPVGYISLIAESLHNFMDGALVAAAYLVDFKIGVATTLAVVLHELPHELGNFGVLLHAGFDRRRALAINFLSACCAVVGALACLLLGGLSNDMPALVLPFATGGFIYIAGTSLLPVLAREKDSRLAAVQFVAIMAGVGLMLLLLRVE
jgi:zinc and cadmium transporter